MTKPIYLLNLFLLIIFVGCPTATAADPKALRAELNKLNAEIERSQVYRDQFIHRIDSLKRKATGATNFEEKWRLTLDVAIIYRLMNADSSIYYAERSLNIADRIENSDREHTESMLHLINALSTAGIFTVAKTHYDSLKGADISDDLKTEYWKTGGMLYSYIMSAMGENSHYADEAMTIYRSLGDSLLKTLPHDDPVYQRMVIDRLIDKGQYADARERGERLLKTLSEDNRQYGLTALQLAVICDFQGDQTNFATYLAKSASSDIKANVTDGMALPALANWLYDNDELDDAYRYVNFALQDASSSTARMRTFAIAQLVPYIDEAYRKKIDSSKNQIWAGFIVVALLLSATIVLIVILVRQNKIAHKGRKNLAKMSKIQESYVGNFVALCSNYANRLDSVTKIVSRKLSSGQADELLKMVKAGKLDGSTDDEDFNKVFDNAFLDMYPNFVKNFNALLRPDQQVEVKSGDGLTPELRIYAFVRLGVDESVRIAQIMRYSVSTVYAYRNRMRNRAIDRENFEAAVAHIEP